MGITIGIDLGTTNSVVCLKKLNVAVVRNAEGYELTPSSVTAVPNPDNSSYDLLVGRSSQDLMKQYPEQTITSVKRLMGRDFEDIEVQNIIKEHRIGYQIMTDSSEPGSIRIPLAGKMQSPEMISGIILSKLIRDGEAEMQGKIDQAVITVPAYFSDRQKFATRAACDYAGIKLLRLLPEPTAAALSFGLGEVSIDETKTIMVFDLGGGTFDISVLSFSGGSFMEITKGGDMWLGGDNIDQLIVNHVFDCAEKTANCKPIIELIESMSGADKARFLVEIKEKAEIAKIELSTAESATIEMFGLLKVKDEDGKLIDIDVTITKIEFTELLHSVIERISAITTQILYEIRFEPELIDTVIMVGGSSLIPAIQEELKIIFGSDKVMIHPRPMLAIAEGAALMAAKIASQDNSTKSQDQFALMHSTAHDYYLQLADGKRHLLVARNTPLPVTVEEKLTFTHIEQSLARLRVFNEVDGILESVGELWFHKEKNELNHNSRPTELMLSFSVDEDNIITMKAWSLQNKQQIVEAQIARGGLAAKLYNDLESTLSHVIANCSDAHVEEDIFDLSRTVITTILSASDPLTGETRDQQKQKAQKQIQLLKDIQQNDIIPLGLYRLAVIAQRSIAGAISDQEKSRLDDIVARFKQALDNLDNYTMIATLEKELLKFYNDIPLAIDLARAENAAVVLEHDSPKDAARIRSQANELKESYKVDDTSRHQNLRATLYDILHANVSWNSMPGSGRFDRDVKL